jgi:predicted DNA-binding transcriptional regulator YafY
MTARRFDASAFATPHLASPNRCRRPIVRVAWLIAVLMRREPISYAGYEARFGRSLRSFRRDIAALRDAGIYLDTNPQGDYLMLCFRPESEAA